MIYELIATIAAGFVGAGIALAIRRMLGNSARWLVPVAAGCGMLAVAIALEYSWFDRTRSTLPDGVEVALTRENRALFRPWTYVAPYVDSFIGVDTASTRTHAAIPQNKLVDLIVFARWNPPSRVSAVFDCNAGRRADLVEGVALAEDGRLTGAQWIETGMDHPVTSLACAGVAS